MTDAEERPECGWSRRSAAADRFREMILPEDDPAGLGIFEIIAAFEQEHKAPPKWTVWRRAKLLKEYRPWLTKHRQKVLRSTDVLPAQWRKYVPSRHHKRAFHKLRPPAGPKRLRMRIRRLPADGSDAPNFKRKARHLAAWQFGAFLTRTEVEKLVARAQR